MVAPSVPTSDAGVQRPSALDAMASAGQAAASSAMAGAAAARALGRLPESAIAVATARSLETVTKLLPVPNREACHRRGVAKQRRERKAASRPANRAQLGSEDTAVQEAFKWRREPPVKCGLSSSA
eukprot:2200207-Alexandrium_andersonii.AAC.1